MQGDAVSIAPGPAGPHLGHLTSPGAWFGEGPFLKGDARRIGLEAATDAALFQLPLEAMESMAAQDPVNMRRFGQIAMLDLDLTLRIIDDLPIPDADRRIAATLLRSIGAREKGTVDLSQAELGRLANASRKVANRTLARFAERGWLVRGYSAIEIVDAPSLRDFAAGDPE